MKTSLQAHQLKHCYGETVALNNLDFSVSASGITAILGTNGAGKSTLINCALGLRKATSGRLLVLGQKPGHPNVKPSIGVMLQDADLPDLLSAREHIELFRSYYSTPLSVDKVSQQCGLDRFMDTRYKHLSGGQKRRVQFALAIVGQPKLLFLDEPTTGLDLDARQAVWSTISELSDAGTAVILTTHYLQEADTLAGHTIVMNNGGIVADDSTEKIRAAVSGTVICCETTLSIQSLKQLPSLRSVELLGRMAKILSSNATNTLASLLKLDPTLKQLTVSKASLEDAFLQLTNAEPQQSVEHNIKENGNVII